MSCSKCHKTKCCCKPSIPLVRGQKKIIKIENRPGQTGPTGSTNLPVANTAFVSKSGNDSTALIERFDKPFLTIQAAINALTTAYTGHLNINNRKQVIVYAGLYEEDVQIKSFIDIHFSDSVLNGTITDGNVSLTSVSAGQYNCIITGNLQLYKKTSNNTPALFIYKANTSLLMKCDSIGADYLDTITILNGNVDLYCKKIFQNSTSSNADVVIEMAQGFLESDYTASKLRIYGADIYRGTDGIGPIIMFSAGGSSKNQTIELHECRVKNVQDSGTAINNACINVGSLLASYGKIILYNTVLYSANGLSINTAASQTATIKCYHSNMSNKSHGGSGTNTFALGSITVNSAVEAEF